jgi:phage-related minor tail protein
MRTPLTTQMDKADATALTQRIRTAVDGLWDMLLEAHDRKAWKALGYKTWEAYVTAEFSMSRRHSYRLLDQGRVINAVRGATGDLCPSGSQNQTGRGHTRTLSAPSASIDISEREARDLKPDLPAVTEEIKARVDAGEDPKKAADETIAAKRAEKEKAKAEAKAAKEKAKAEKAAKQAELDRQREEHRAKLPEAVKQQQAAREAAIEARKAKPADPDEVLADADRIAELEEAVRVLEAENAELKAEIKANADLYGEMKVQWESGGYDKVIADKDGVIRVLESRLYQESADKVSWMRSAQWWKEQAIKLGWSNDEVIYDGEGEVGNG